MELLGNEVPQRPAIAVLHPAIGTDKPENATIRQRRQRPFDERDVEIGPVVDRCVARAVFCQQDSGNQLLPHIGGLPIDEIVQRGSRAFPGPPCSQGSLRQQEIPPPNEGSNSRFRARSLSSV
jgi:hypothetical protein